MSRSICDAKTEETTVLGTVSVRGASTGFTLRCDAVAADTRGRDSHVLLLSAAGAETAVKALAALIGCVTAGLVAGFRRA